MGLDQIVWGKMFTLTVGSFQFFIKIMTLIPVLHVKVYIFPQTSIFIFSVETIQFSVKGRYVRRLYVWNIEYNPSLFFRIRQIPYMLWISWIFIDFQGFSQFLHRFSWIPIHFYVFLRFSWISKDFCAFSWISMDLESSGSRMSDRSLWHPERPCATLCRRIGFP